MKTENVAPPEKVGGNIVGGMIPYIFILLCFTGAMYPAMDLTAGEKERGTLETILCSPVARTDLVLGKFLVVLAASLGTVVISLLSMGATFLIGGMLLAKSDVGAAAMAAAKSGAAQGFTLPTIDPEDARDHDDAVWVERHGDGFRAWIAIADVSEFVVGVENR